MTQIKEARAPASIANICVGYDVLGHAFPVLYDQVRACKIPKDNPLRLTKVTGIVSHLPEEIEKNTALRSVQALLDDQKPEFSIEIEIEKNIPLSGGLGGSAASAVAALLAVNQHLEKALDKNALLDYALEGEYAASGAYHYDNVAPCLLGGLVFASYAGMISLPVPDFITCLVFSPNVKMNTQAARKLIKSKVSQTICLDYARNLAGFITALYQKDKDLLRASMKDVWIEPQRAGAFPYFYPVQTAALESGALGCSLSGSGPSVFAWCLKDQANKISEKMHAAFIDQGYQVKTYQADFLSQKGAC